MRVGYVCCSPCPLLQCALTLSPLVGRACLLLTPPARRRRSPKWIISALTGRFIFFPELLRSAAFVALVAAHAARDGSLTPGFALALPLLALGSFVLTLVQASRASRVPTGLKKMRTFLTLLAHTLRFPLSP